MVIFGPPPSDWSIIGGVWPTVVIQIRVYFLFIHSTAYVEQDQREIIKTDFSYATAICYQLF